MLLAVLMLLSLCGTCFAEPAELSAADAQTQLELIFANLKSFQQDEKEKTWYYAVTDLDHNGRLELIAASMRDEDRSTNLKAWQVNDTGAFFVACTVNLEEDESFPDILSENADTFYDEEKDEWYYLFYDNIILSDSEAYAVKCSVTLNDNEISYERYAVQHTQNLKGQATVEYMDPDGNPITQDAYNAAGVNAFPDKDRSSTNLDWFLFADASQNRLKDSYAVFTGEKQPEKTSPLPTPSPMPSPAPTPQPPQPTPTYLMITKNPTNEYHNEGETAWFIANATCWTSLKWTAVGTNGVEYPIDSFNTYFPNCPVSGANGPSLSIGNLTTAMDGFGFYCTFYYYGQTARTNTAFVYVSENPPQPVVLYGTVTNAAMSTVDIYLTNGMTVEVLRDICDVEGGTLAVGCNCTVYFKDASSYSSDNVSYVYIEGSNPQPPDPTPPPVPTYNQIGGTITDAAMSTAQICLDNGQTVSVLTDIINVVYGSLSVGSSCTVYYTGDYPTQDSIYSVDVYGMVTDTGTPMLGDAEPETGVIPPGGLQ